MKHTLFLMIFLCGCSSEPAPSDIREKEHSSTVASASELEKQLNLTILLDLSDRIDPVKNADKPEHYQKDSTLIRFLTEYFIGQMKVKGANRSKGKMRVIFHPNPQALGINQAAAELSIDLSIKSIDEKATVYKTLRNTVTENIRSIYESTIRRSNWIGSDIWRFFKNDVKEIAVDPDSSYRNLLVIFTDGYLYHADSKDNDKNRYAYVLPELFDKYKLRNDNNWSKKIDDLDFGLISKRADLEQLEVLVLEVTPSSKHKDDEDILRKILDKWFTEMKVKRWKIINSDLPQFTKQKISNFLSE